VATRSPFSLEGKVAVVTGGYGVLGGHIAAGLAAAGARVAILGRRREMAERKVEELCAAGGEARTLIADVVDEAQLDAARDELLAEWGRLDILVNAAGGNVARARSDNRPVFDVPLDATEEVFRLNLHGTLIPSLRFGEVMGRQRSGAVVNISSMAAMRAITGTLGYSIAKAGIDSLTRWLAVDRGSRRARRQPPALPRCGRRARRTHRSRRRLSPRVRTGCVWPRVWLRFVRSSENRDYVA